jgi:hypothetical protein
LFFDHVYLRLSKLFMKVSLNSELFDLEKYRIWSLLKLLFLETNANLKVNLVMQISSKLFYSNSRQLLSDLCPNPISRLSIYVQIFNPNLYSLAESLMCRPLINSYLTRLNISMSDPNSKPTSAVILKCHDSPFLTKNPKVGRISS